MVFLDNSSSDWKSIKFWRDLIPSLTITDYLNNRNKADRCEIDPTLIQQIHSQLQSSGYGLVDFSDVINEIEKRNPKAKANSKTLISTLAQSIEILIEKNLPSCTILLYDEIWYLSQIAGTLISQSTHCQNVINYDMLAFYVNPSLGQSGFTPHRDRQPNSKSELKKSFHPSNGHAKYITLWLALTDATPENSCLYMIPKQYDPGYLEGDCDDNDIECDNHHNDPLQRALSTKSSYQNIRAVPRSPGQAVIFNHRILHWGSKGNHQCTSPRIALSFVSSDPAFEKPYLNASQFELHATNNSNDNNPSDQKMGQKKQNIKKIQEMHKCQYPPFHVRLVLVCAQLLIYHERMNLDVITIRACYEFCKCNENILEEAYRKKVFVEFVKAMKDARARHSACESVKQSRNGDDTNNHDNSSSCHDHTQDMDLAQENADLTLTITATAKKSNKTIIGFDNGGISDSDEDDEDAMLEAMIDAEEAGCGDFEDDFDDQFSNANEEIIPKFNDAEGSDDYEDISESDEVIFGTKSKSNNGHSKGEEEEKIKASVDCNLHVEKKRKK